MENTSSNQRSEDSGYEGLSSADNLPKGLIENSSSDDRDFTKTNDILYSESLETILDL